MQSKSNKLVYLFTGIIIGFFLGSGIVWYKLTNNINDLFSLYKGLLYEKNKGELKEIVSNSGKNDIIPSGKYKNTYIPDSLLRNLPDEEKSYDYNDSTSDKASQNNKENNNNIVVAKDELVALRKFNIEGNKQKIQESRNNLDSLLTDDKNPKSKKNNNSIVVEFWKSPINYKGYRYDNYKLVIFGINDYEVSKFRYFESILYMKYQSDFYEIETTDKFKPIILVSNQEVIKKLNIK